MRHYGKDRSEQLESDSKPPTACGELIVLSDKTMSGSLKSHLLEWAARYVPPELGGITGTLVGGLLVFRSHATPEALGVGGTIGELVGFYSVVIGREFWGIRAELNWRIGWLTARNLILEFGVAEALDSLILRPLLIDFSERYTGRPVLSLLAGKLLTDIAFYLMAITAYEWQKRKGYRK